MKVQYPSELSTRISTDEHRRIALRGRREYPPYVVNKPAIIFHFVGGGVGEKSSGSSLRPP